MATTPRPSFMLPNGTIPVKAGDMISKYCMTMYGNYGSKTTTWPKFKRFDKNNKLIEITNYDLIYTGETLAHVDFYTGNGGGSNGGGPIGINPPVTGNPGTTQPGSGGGGLAVEFKSPTLKIPFKDPKEVGYFCFQLEVSAKGKVGPKDPSYTLTNELPELERKIPLDFGQQFDASIGVSLGLDQLKTIREGCVTADPDKFREAMVSTVKFKAQTGQHPLWRNFNWTGDLSLEPSLTPVGLTFTVSTSGEVLCGGRLFLYEAEVSVTLKLGLSKKGWMELCERVGKPAVRAIVQLIGPELAATCSYWCGFVLLAVGATVMTEQLFEWIIENANATGDKKQASFEYGQAYSHVIFEKTPFKYPGSSNKEMLQLFRGVAESAMVDVAEDMRGPEVGLTFPNPGTPVYVVGAGIQWNAPREALNIYKSYLVAAADGSVENARRRIEIVAEEKARRRFGI